MKSFLAFIKKEFLHLLRDTRSLAIIFILPIVLVILFGFAITNEIKNAKVVIVDHAKDEMSEKLINKLLASGYFSCYETLERDDQIQSAFTNGKVAMVIVFPNDFSKKIYQEKVISLQLILDAADINFATTMEKYTTSIVQNFKDELVEGKAEFTLFSPEIRFLYNPEMKSVYMFVPGVLALIVMIVSALMACISLTKEREFGTLRVLIVTPLKAQTIIFGKVIPYLLISLVNILIILALSTLIFHIPVKGSLWLLFALSLIFVFNAVSFGIWMSTLVSKQEEAMMACVMALFLPTILLSGFIFPLKNMPIAFQYVGQIVPAKWFIQAFKDIMIKGAGIELVWPALVILSSMAAFMMWSSIRNFKKRRGQ